MTGRKFAIGVTGHRTPPQLPADRVAEVRGAVDAVVAALGRVAGASGHDGITVVSGLAEGADRIVAEAGLRAGGDLIAVLPFSEERYREDFEDPASKAAFARLLAAAARVEVAATGGADAPAAYEAAGRAVVEASDTLVAIWDGAPARGRGGTAEIVARARRKGVPVLWIAPDRPDCVTLMDGTGKVAEVALSACDEPRLDAPLARLLRGSGARS